MMQAQRHPLFIFTFSFAQSLVNERLMVKNGQQLIQFFKISTVYYALLTAIDDQICCCGFGDEKNFMYCLYKSFIRVNMKNFKLKFIFILYIIHFN